MLASDGGQVWWWSADRTLISKLAIAHPSFAVGMRGGGLMVRTTADRLDFYDAGGALVGTYRAADTIERGFGPNQALSSSASVQAR